MEFRIKNCNNITDGTLEITKGKLNIKFGINGTGKSTISRAIKYSIESPELLNQLTPFKLREIDTQHVPEIIPSEEIGSVLIFNEEYVDRFLFREDELIANSYDILIKTPAYNDSIVQIEHLLSEIKKVFSENDDLDKIIVDFENLTKSFTTTQTGLSKTSALYKGLKGGNLIEHIPVLLQGYGKLIKDKNCVSWLDWQNKGDQFLEISDDCPYCTSPTTETKEAIKSVTLFYDKNVIKNFNVIVEALKNLGDYFSESANQALKEITEKQTGLEESEMHYIIVVKQQIDDLLLKLKSLKNISPSSFSEDEEVNVRLQNLKINVDLFDRIKGDKTTRIISSLNNSLDTVLEKIGLLKGEINKQRHLVNSLIQKHKDSINSFLVNAGFKYKVEIEGYKLLLRHSESTEILSGGKQHLSYGEKNAFALILFMYETLQKQPDLIVLDDPVSSFDKSKKYAIMHMLFRGRSDECLLNNTVLLFTHDLDPVIDTVKVLREFGNLSEARFLSNINGRLSEIEIKKDNILSFAQICRKVNHSNSSEIIKLIYLRRNYEIINDLGNEYQVISNLFHKRQSDECTDHRKEIGNDTLDEADFNAGIVEIKKTIIGFDYDSILSNLNNIQYLKRLIP